MIRFVEACVFVGLAAAVHAGLLSYAPGPVGSAADGGGGQEVASLVSARASDAAMVQMWKTPPVAATSHADLTPIAAPATAVASVALPRPTLPQPSRLSTPNLPMMAPTDAPQIDTSPAALLVAPAPEPPKVSPIAKPAPKKPTPPKTAAKPALKTQPAAKATGQGTRKAAGSQGAAKTHSASKATENALQAKWGRQIHRKLSRAFVYPKGVKGKGTARLELQLSPNGKLRGVRLVRGTGIAALDKAALRAAKRAGRFPKAPKGLTRPTYKFTMPLEFRG